MFFWTRRPLGDNVPVQPPEAVQLLALVERHLRTLLPPALINVALAEIETVTGRAVAATSVASVDAAALLGVEVVDVSVEEAAELVVLAADVPGAEVLAVEVSGMEVLEAELPGGGTEVPDSDAMAIVSPFVAAVSVAGIGPVAELPLLAVASSAGCVVVLPLDPALDDVPDPVCDAPSAPVLADDPAVGTPPATEPPPPPHAPSRARVSAIDIFSAPEIHLGQSILMSISVRG